MIPACAPARVVKKETAGVEITPHISATPPASAIARSSTVSSQGPEMRVSRAMRIRGRGSRSLKYSVRQKPTRYTVSQSKGGFPATPRIPSVPKIGSIASSVSAIRVQVPIKLLRASALHFLLSSHPPEAHGAVGLPFPVLALARARHGNLWRDDFFDPN